MLSLKSPFQIIAAALIAVDISAFGQAPNTDFKILKVEPNFLESPTYSGPRYDKRGARAKSWLEIEVSFEWQPRLRDPKFTDELTFNYYILLQEQISAISTGDASGWFGHSYEHSSRKRYAFGRLRQPANLRTLL